MQNNYVTNNEGCSLNLHMNILGILNNLKYFKKNMCDGENIKVILFIHK